MADTTFVSGTVITSEWANDVNDFTYNDLVNVKNSEWGAIADNSTNDATALNAAAVFCSTNNKTLFIPAGNYRISSTIVFENCNIEAKGAVFYPDSSVTTGIQFGTASTIYTKRCTGLAVRGGGISTQPALSSAIKIINASQAVFDNVEANRFPYGINVEPIDATRIAYCTFLHPYVHRCTQNFRIYVDTVTGYAAENTVIGGRLQRAAIPDDCDYHVYAEKTSGSGSINHWRWWGTAMESSTGATQPLSAMRLRRCDYWNIRDVRTEGVWVNSDFEFDANSTDNLLELRYADASGISVIDYNGTNQVKWQKISSLGSVSSGSVSTSCIERFYRNGTARIQVLSDGTSLPGVSLGSIADESAVELVWVPSSSSIGVRVGGTLIAEAVTTGWRPATDGTLNSGGTSRKWNNTYTNQLVLADGVTAPSTVVGHASIYVDTADGDLKIKFADGTVKTIVTDT